MSCRLRPGTEVRTESSGLCCRVDEFLGAGGQGEVYRARLGQKPVALKWYYPQAATDGQRQALEVLIRKGAPNGRFLWPLELALLPGTSGFGYVMPLREPSYRGIVDLMKARVSPSFRALATAGFELADSYLELHARGLCYRDISFGNVFFEPSVGHVRICDNDNIAVDGAPSPGVIGTPRFMAPEVVRGQALPSIQTDLFSLAVLLFYMLVVHHPLEGAKEVAVHCLDLPAMNRLYGSEPVFIFDPDNQTNRPVAGYHDNALAYWPLLPTFMRDLFTRSFTEGLRDPAHGRVRESEWRSALVQLRDAIIFCTHCSPSQRQPTENFYDLQALKASGGKPANCWHCQTQLQLPPRIRIGRHVVMLYLDTVLTAHHVQERLYDFDSVVGRVVAHPQQPGKWGLRNQSLLPWKATLPDGSSKEVPPGKSVSIVRGTRIDFGKAQGQLEA